MAQPAGPVAPVGAAGRAMHGRATSAGDVTKSLREGLAWKGSNLPGHPKNWTLLPDRAQPCQPGRARALPSSAKSSSRPWAGGGTG